MTGHRSADFDGAAWTLEELVARAASVLAQHEVRAPNGRVTPIPDARVIRWYATIGLLDRPTIVGRASRYGPRHLLQLVAIKRRQAEGRTLAEIQLELAGATDRTLRRAAGVESTAGVEGIAQSGFESPAQAGVEVSVQSVQPVAAVLHGVPLGGGAILLIPGQPAVDDSAAIARAATPLVDLLARRGLLARTNPEGEPA